MIQPITTNNHAHFLKQLLKGEVADDQTIRLLYSTDASAYQEMPQAVVWPRDERDVQLLISYASKNSLALIPRGAGTSLAGQVVGNGIVVDQSKYLNNILQINTTEQWVDVQPGVVLDELNLFLRPHGLFFGPETSTSNRCTIGGMVGNNSCGSRSIVYGSTRDHLLEIEGYLSSGERVVANKLSPKEFDDKLKLKNTEGHIYREIFDLLNDTKTQSDIASEFPHPDIKRRNTGYAIDLLCQTDPFTHNGEPFNLCKIIAGSEGTLLFATRIRLNLLPLPPSNDALLCVHLNSLDEAVRANLIALKHNPLAVELMDKTILDLTKHNIVQQKNRFFIVDDPQALLLVELNGPDNDTVHQAANNLIDELKNEGLGFAFPTLKGGDIGKVWSLRKAGLGVLSNIPGDEFPVPVIEDTAIRPEDLQSYLADIAAMLQKHNKSCVYYGHIGSGELHLRPVLNMKLDNDIKLFRTIAEETAVIVKKHRGSLSGEHGDGRLRGEFIPLMVGNENYERLKKVKKAFDPHNIFNPGKITDTPPMDQHLRYSKASNAVMQPAYRWEKTGGLLQGADKCNGSADCRKSSLIGGTMCPSFMATRNETHTTRARANILRLYMTGQLGPDNDGLEEVKSVLDLCLMCKACKAECPSNIDVAKLKAEFLWHYGQKVGFSMRDYLFAYQHVPMRWASKMPGIYNKLVDTQFLNTILHRFLKVRTEGHLPKVAPFDAKAIESPRNKSNPQRQIWLFVDEITRYDESPLALKTSQLLQRLGYAVKLAPIEVSGRTFISKGMLDKAKTLANTNVKKMAPLIHAQTPLVGIEPSAILTFRDEYPDLVDDALISDAQNIAKNTFTIEEFLWREIEKGIISKDSFTKQTRQIAYHAHCYQKSLSDSSITQKLLSFPENYTATEIKSGCCGMAGSFGYESEHADIARRIGELTLFPAVRECHPQTLIAASGTSCRSHMAAHTNKATVHPVEILYVALAQG